MFRFDVSSITTKELMAFNKAEASAEVEAISIYMAKFCIEAGESDPNNPDTFAEADFGTYMEALAALRETFDNAVARIETGDLAVAADFRHVKAKEVGKRFLQPMKSGDFQAIANFLAEVVTECPKDWGKSDVSDTYMKLPYFSAFSPLCRQILQESRAPKKSPRK
jgi:hypothetical protein